MDSDQGKLFIGGISWETTEEKLRDYFGKYGEVVQAVVMRDKVSGRPRGFGFVVFADPALVDCVLEDKHTIDGRVVEAKRAMSREEQHTSSKAGNPAADRTMGGSGGAGTQRTKKIFVGGLPQTLTEEGFRNYFEAYGTVTDVVIMYDQNTQRPRGFGFITFDSEDAVDRVLHKTFHDLNGKLVEVKRAMPKDALNQSGGGGGGGGGGNRSMGGGNGGYQSYGGSNPTTGSYDGRIDANRYMQPQAGGGFPPYGSTVYGAPGYGYGAPSNGVGYGGYGISGYGGATAGYSGPAGAYGNPAAPAAAYGGGPPGAPRSPWSNQAPSGYGSAGYGANAGFSAAASWNAQGGGGAQTGQSPGGMATMYGNQGYGYGNYGGSDSSYGSQGGYGAVGGRGGVGGGAIGASGDQHATSSGYMYGDASGGSGLQSGWKSDPSQGGGYGAAQVNGPPGPGYYGGVQSRQAQQ